MIYEEIFKNLIMVFMGIILMLTSSISEASPVVVNNVIGIYQLGDKDTIEQARKGALEDAKRMAVEQVGVMIESNTIVEMGTVVVDQIRSAACAKVKIIGNPVYEIIENGYKYRVTINAEVDPDVVNSEMNRIVEKNRNNVNKIERKIEKYDKKLQFTQEKEINNVSEPKNYFDSERQIINQKDPLAKLGAIAYNGKLYKVFNVSMDWNKAWIYCKTNGGNLLIIESEEEQNFIVNLMKKKGTKNSYWIGAGRDGDKIRWVNGTDMEYTHWGKDQPDNYLGRESVVMIYRNPNPMVKDSRPGDWNDARFDGECNNEPFFGIKNIGFICEWSYDQ